MQEFVHQIIGRALSAAESEDKNTVKNAIEQLVGLIHDQQLRLDFCEKLIDENIQEAEEVAKALAGWTEGEDHPRDMRVALACACLLSAHEPLTPTGHEDDNVYTDEKRSKILIINKSKIAVIECYSGGIILPMMVALEGESAAQAACRGADALMGLDARIVRNEPFFSTEDGSPTSVFLCSTNGSSRPHLTHPMGYLRWVDLAEAEMRLSGLDAKALSHHLPDELVA